MANNQAPAIRVLRQVVLHRTDSASGPTDRVMVTPMKINFIAGLVLLLFSCATSIFSVNPSCAEDTSVSDLLKANGIRSDSDRLFSIWVNEEKANQDGASSWQHEEGAVIRGPVTEKRIYLVFTGHEYAEGGEVIRKALTMQRIKASFFFTGDFYRNKSFQSIIRKLRRDGHYLGPHSDKHLLYVDWKDRQHLLVDQESFKKDLRDNYEAMKKHGIDPRRAGIFIPPFEWFNQTISQWARSAGVTLINYTPGTISYTDYKSPLDNGRYYSSKEIHAQILEYEQKDPFGLNGFILLFHIGAGPGRPDKFFLRLESLLVELKKRGYFFSRVDTMPENPK